jgi:multicomponent Na+:H+ antiporter subunit A
MATAAAILSGFALALAAPGLCRIARGATGWILALLPLGQAVYFARLLGAIPPEGHPSVRYPWVPSLGIELSFLVDGLGLLFALLITVVGALVFVYAGGYLSGHPQLGRFYAFLLLFMASMLGLVLADNVVTLFVFWELTSLSSYLLIGFDHERAEARAAALQALLVTGAGGLALLAGLLLLGHAGGSYELSDLLRRGEVLRSSDLYLPILLLILVGAFTKSAQFPFHFWLPAAMEAPTPVSAYLHSATMVKAGVYLLARLHLVLGGTAAWFVGVTTFGTITMVVGAWLAVQQSDLKRILAYSTVSALGLLVMLLGLGTVDALAAALVFLLAHALYKGALFLVAGAVDHETGTRDTDRLGELVRRMPVTALAAVLAALSMAGLPPLFGFIAKEAVYETTQHAPLAALLTAAALLTSLLFVVVAAVVGLQPFFRQRADLPRHPHEAPPSLWLGPFLLAACGLTLGLAPGLVDGPLLGPALAAVQLARERGPLGLALWHGWNPAAALSIVTVAGGVAVYLLRGRLRSVAENWSTLSRWGPAHGYELTLAGLNAVARIQTRLLQSGYLRHYLLAILLASLGLIGFTLATHVRLPGALDLSDIRFYEAGLVALLVLAILATVSLPSRLGAIAALGVVGFSVALLFVLFGAPDLAMTQFLIETLTVILFVLVFYHLPTRVDVSSRAVRLRDGLVASAVGGLMTALVVVAVNVQFSPAISDYYAAESLPQGHGRNVVNVILVDFRGLDTLGEITVLAAAAVGVYALLKLRLGKGKER